MNINKKQLIFFSIILILMIKFIKMLYLKELVYKIKVILSNTINSLSTRERGRHGVAARTRSSATHARSHFPPGLGNFPKPFWCFPRVACPSMPSKIISFAAFASAAFFIASREQSGHFPPLFGFLHIGHEYNHGYEVFTEWLLASLPSP